LNLAGYTGFMGYPRGDARARNASLVRCHRLVVESDMTRSKNMNFRNGNVAPISLSLRYPERRIVFPRVRLLRKPAPVGFGTDLCQRIAGQA